jgi:hypothetical protein
MSTVDHFGGIRRKVGNRAQGKPRDCMVRRFRFLPLETRAFLPEVCGLARPWAASIAPAGKARLLAEKARTRVDQEVAALAS